MLGCGNLRRVDAGTGNVEHCDNESVLLNIEEAGFQSPGAAKDAEACRREYIFEEFPGWECYKLTDESGDVNRRIYLCISIVAKGGERGDSQWNVKSQRRVQRREVR